MVWVVYLTVPEGLYVSCSPLPVTVTLNRHTATGCALYETVTIDSLAHYSREVSEKESRLMVMNRAVAPHRDEKDRAPHARVAWGPCS
ncbi:MAG TPA: hypothetical protein PKZ42_06890 [Syntrophales bacterium]|nr:hypothetical protein [Syntrophales bacterium]